MSPVEQPAALLWPEDSQSDAPVPATAEPDRELAVILLASGCTHSYVRRQCGFQTMRDVATFARDSDVRQEVEAVAGDRVRRIGKRAMVRLERLLSTEHTDLRATVLAVRTGLELSGDLKREATAPVKSVRELTVPELSALIDSTRAELNQRVSRLGTDGRNAGGGIPIESEGCSQLPTDSKSVGQRPTSAAIQSPTPAPRPHTTRRA